MIDVTWDKRTKVKAQHGVSMLAGAWALMLATLLRRQSLKELELLITRT